MKTQNCLNLMTLNSKQSYGRCVCNLDGLAGILYSPSKQPLKLYPVPFSCREKNTPKVELSAHIIIMHSNYHFVFVFMFEPSRAKVRELAEFCHKNQFTIMRRMQKLEIKITVIGHPLWANWRFCLFCKTM